MSSSPNRANHGDHNAAGTPRPPVRLAYLVSHPIQYQSPLLRRIAAQPDIDLTVFFGSDFSVKGYADEGFGVEVKWDVPLLEGFRHEFLPNLRDQRTGSGLSAISYGFTKRLLSRDGTPAFDALWVHGYASANSLHAMVVARSLGIPVLLRAESWLRDRQRSGTKLVAKQALFSLLQRLVNATLPIGTLNAAYWSHYLGPECPQFLMPYTVDNDYFQQRSQAAQAGRAELQLELVLDPARPVILFASKLQTRKHCADLVAAYLQLRPAADQDPVPYLVIVGDGEERAALERQVTESGVTSVRFCGFRNQSELPRFFDLSSVFVLPSRHEAWGLIVNEVMNAARAVIITDDCGCQPDLVTDGVEGCVYPVRDVDALAAALRRVLATPETAATMGRNALARINRWNFAADIDGLRRALAYVTGKHGMADASSQTMGGDSQSVDASPQTVDATLQSRVEHPR
jgi:glycosyltransferase involved in cell wall biosynthesis